jgi:glycosyltransferase involved in cell wall biosynthesis
MLSIVICTYNRAEKLKLVLDDVLNNPLNVHLDFELIVVDNNSKDQTEPVVKAFDASLSPRLRYVFEERQGLSNARNRGVCEARGEWICFTDDDVRLDRNWLTSISSAIKANPQMAAYGGRIKAKWVADPPKWFIREGRYAMNGGAIVSCDLGNDIFSLNEKDMHPIGANMGFRKDVFDKVGLFHPALGKMGNTPSLGEDAEFSKRVSDAGYEILYLPDSIVWHDIEIDRLQAPMMKQFYYELGYFRGKQRMFPKQAVWIFGAPRYLFKELLSFLLGALGLRFVSRGKSYYYLFMFHYVRGQLKGCYEK